MITGAASGIGRALAQRLSRLGSPLAIADIDEAGLEKTAASLSGPVLRRVLDVGDAADQLRFAEEVLAWLPEKLAAVFNTAGVAVASSVRDAAPEDDDWLIGINFRGVVNGTRAFLPILLAQDEGVIVNTSSVFGLVGMPYQSAYCASKFAVRGFTESLRAEMLSARHPVRVTVVHPGGVKTNIASAALSEAQRAGVATPEQERRTRAYNEKLLKMPAARAAAIILDGVEAGKTRIRVGNDARGIDLLVRLLPRLYPRLTARVLSRLDRQSS